MLQRSPTYFFCSENQNELADRLRQIGIDEPTIHRVVRAQIMHDQDMMTRRCQAEPDAVFEELKALIRHYAGEDFQFEPHFTPKYRVWQQRLAFCPEGDVFKAAVAGKLSVVTDTLQTVHRKRRAYQLGRRDRGRHHRRRHRLPPLGDGRHSVLGGRQAGQLARHGQLSRHDVHRRAELALGDRLFPRQLDAARRHARRFRLQSAEPHGRNRREAGRRRAARRRQGHADAAVDRGRQLQSRAT